MTKNKFIKDESQLIESILKFMEAPEYWREAVGKSPKYFAHFKSNDEYYFGLSKFCAFKDINLSDYVAKFRKKANGTQTQKHIEKKINKRWIPFEQVESNIREEFKKWFFSFFPSTYNLEKQIYILTIGNESRKLYLKEKKKRKSSPEDIERRLKEQIKIGKVGELIAYQYELERLNKLKIKNSEKWIDHVSKRNASAGFDIWSHPPQREARFIEVKSSTTDPYTFLKHICI